MRNSRAVCIIPRIYGRALRLPSSVILFSLLAGSVLLGIVGALLALPVAAAVLMLIEELRVELPGQQEQAEDVEIRERDDRGEEEYERRAEGMPAEQAAAIAVEISTDRHKEENSPPTKTDAPVDVGTGIDLPASPGKESRDRRDSMVRSPWTPSFRDFIVTSQMPYTIVRSALL